MRESGDGLLGQRDPERVSGLLEERERENQWCHNGYSGQLRWPQGLENTARGKHLLVIMSMITAFLLHMYVFLRC